MELSYREYGRRGSPAVFFLHGLLGSSANWSMPAKRLAEEDDFRCFCIDLRNHGNSPHSGRMDYPLMAHDVLSLARRLALGKVCIAGHSMGGKVAMEAALQDPSAVGSVAVADIAPSGYKPGFGGDISALRQLDLSAVKKRSDADSLLSAAVPDRKLRMFFLTNLRRNDGGGYSWRINLDGIIENFNNIWAGIEGGRVFGGPALFLKGEHSGFIKDGDLPLITELFPGAVVKEIAGAGHWIHADNPEGYLDTLRSFLRAFRIP